MATNRESKIQILFSSATGATPDVGVLDYGELALNIVDNKLYFKGEDDALEYFSQTTGGGDVTSVNGHTGDVVIVTYSDTPPSSPGTGDLWFESDTGSFYAYLDDGDSLQWVEINGTPGPTGATGPQGEQGIQGSTGATGPAGETPTTYVETFNGLTGTVDTSSLTLHVAGISSDGGATFGDIVTVTESIKIADAGSAVVSTINQNGSNMQFYPAGGLIVSINGSGIYTFGRNYSSTFTEAGTYLKAGSYVHAGTGISLDAGGITFPDGTYQDTAATSITDYVSTVNGQTGGVTAGGAGIRFTFESTLPSIGSGEICITSTILAISDTTANGLDMSSALQDFNDAGGGSILVSDSSGDSVLYVSNIPASSITDQTTYWRFTLGDYDLVNDEANMVQGEDLYLSLIPFSPSSAVKHVAGFLYDGRGSAVSSGTKTSVVRPVEGNATVNYFGIRSSGAVSSGVTGHVYVVPESYINSAGASFETDGITIGSIGLATSEIGKTGGSVDVSGITLGDLLFCGLEGSGWTGSVQLFVHYEV